MKLTISFRARWILFALPLLGALGTAAAAAAVASADPAPSSPIAIGSWTPLADRSPKPKPDEWANATPLELVRAHDRCKAAALREWIRVSCTYNGDELMGLRPIGGSDEDVSIADYKVGRDGDHDVNGIHVILPVRKGDRRLLALNSWESGGWKSFYIVEDTYLVISELWLPADPSPTITVH